MGFFFAEVSHLKGFHFRDERGRVRVKDLPQVRIGATGPLQALLHGTVKLVISVNVSRKKKIKDSVLLVFVPIYFRQVPGLDSGCDFLVESQEDGDVVVQLSQEILH